MKLLIISHTEHFKKGDSVAGWGPTIREINHLATLFDEVVHVATLNQGPAPESALPYSADNIRLAPVAPSGGSGLLNKLNILLQYPVYLLTILRELRGVDVVHIRCPANISLLAVLLITFLPWPRRRWTKYAGNWSPDGREAFSYTLQRWWLNKGLQRGVVTVNGRWPGQPAHVHSFYNPCLTEEELQEGARYAASKVPAVPLRLLYVGRLETPKGVRRILEITAQLHEMHVPVFVDLVGDGPEKPAFEEYVVQQGIQESVKFHGWVPRDQLGPIYAQAHLMIFPSSSSEGWPKVLSEAMAYGVVPVTSTVSSVPQYLQDFKVGQTFAADDLQGFVKAVVWYSKHTSEWKQESDNAVQAANLFSYQNYLNSVKQLLEL
ncbi:MAG: glycosyltransferase [Pseudomonadales bacterium]|nr:glycosyltransferase [Pseudomonadales bacterium]